MKSVEERLLYLEDEAAIRTLAAQFADACIAKSRWSVAVCQRDYHYM